MRLNCSGFWLMLEAHVNAIEDRLSAMSDLPPQPPTTPFQHDGTVRLLAELVHAFKFLTRLPIPFSRTIDPPPLRQTMRMFSLVGAFIGAMIGLVLLAGQFAELPAFLASILAVSAGLVLTGALHEDGMADTADGLGGGKTREQRLAIMRDSRIGSYGTLALIITVGIRVACYADLLFLSPFTLLAVITACNAFSRALMVDLLWATAPARSEGLSAYAGQPSRGVAMFAIIIGLLLTLLAGHVTFYENAILALGLALAATAGLRWLAIRLVGGQTGDICGAVQIACELMMLIAFVATLR
jgi:adenosylcobinamide-GDP ribazoletransferase